MIRERDDGPAEKRADAAGRRPESSPPPGDTFGVAIHVTEADLQFVVRVPPDIDSEWTDPEEFQRLVESVVWEILDKRDVLRDVAAAADNDTTVSLGTVTLRPDGILIGHSLAPPHVDA